MAKAILIADDFDDDVLMVKLALAKADIKNPVLAVDDGDQAIAYLKGEGKYANREKFPLPGLLLLDLKMPRMNGHHVLAWLRTHGQFKDLLIIVLSGCDDAKDVQEAYGLGAHSYLVKPCGADDIKNLMRWFPTDWDTGSTNSIAENEWSASAR
jgi:CheY-like chemotaxis protein